MKPQKSIRLAIAGSGGVSSHPSCFFLTLCGYKVELSAFRPENLVCQGAATASNILRHFSAEQEASRPKNGI